jgi:hypothetical protein
MPGKAPARKGLHLEILYRAFFIKGRLKNFAYWLYSLIEIFNVPQIILPPT